MHFTLRITIWNILQLDSCATETHSKTLLTATRRSTIQGNALLRYTGAPLCEIIRTPFTLFARQKPSTPPTSPTVILHLQPLNRRVGGYQGQSKGFREEKLCAHALFTALTEPTQTRNKRQNAVSAWRLLILPTAWTEPPMISLLLRRGGACVVKWSQELCWR